MLKRTILAVAIACTLPAAAQVDMNALLQGAGSNMRMVPDTDPFQPNVFIGSFTMTMVSNDGKKDVPSTIRFYSSADKTLMRTSVADATKKKGEASILMDHRDKWTYMLMNENKRGTALKLKKMKLVDDAADAPADPPQVTVTNETRTIHGHACTKVIVKSEDGTWTGWVTKDIAAPFADIARSLGAGNHQSTKDLGDLQGFPLEYTWEDINGQGRMECRISDLQVGSVDASVFSLDGYTVMEMPSHPHIGQ